MNFEQLFAPWPSMNPYEVPTSCGDVKIRVSAPPDVGVPSKMERAVVDLLISLFQTRNRLLCIDSSSPKQVSFETQKFLDLPTAKTAQLEFLSLSNAIERLVCATYKLENNRYFAWLDDGVCSSDEARDCGCGGVGRTTVTLSETLFEIACSGRSLADISVRELMMREIGFQKANEQVNFFVPRT